SAVFHKVFQSCFACWNRPYPLASGSKWRLRVAPPSRPLRTASTSPSNHRCRSRRTEWRASNVKWKDDTRPPANIFPTIIFLIYIARDIALQDHRAEIIAEEAAHRELALLLIA